MKKHIGTVLILAGTAASVAAEAPPAPTAAMSQAEQATGAVSAVGALTTAQIQQLQRALRRSGHYKGVIDGVAGPATLLALAAFQQDKALTAVYLDDRSAQALGLSFGQAAPIEAAAEAQEGVDNPQVGASGVPEPTPAPVQASAEGQAPAPAPVVEVGESESPSSEEDGSVQGQPAPSPAPGAEPEVTASEKITPEDGVVASEAEPSTQSEAPTTAAPQQRLAKGQAGTSSRQSDELAGGELQAPVLTQAAVAGQSVESRTLSELPRAQLQALQRRLRELGFYKGQLDGFDGPRTRQALRDFFNGQLGLLIHQARITPQGAAALGLSLDQSEGQEGTADEQAAAAATATPALVDARQARR